MRWVIVALAGVSFLLAVKQIYLFFHEHRSRDDKFRMYMEISLTIILTYGAITWK